jgi:8-oxo-dGTP diphosphatase
MINVTAAIIERDGKILIAKRSSTSSLPNKWEFPGGKVEVGETPEICLARELYEEFDIIVTVGDFIAESVYQYEKKTVRLLGFRVQYDDEIKVMNAHDDVRWVPVDDLLEYDLAPADVPIAQKIGSGEIEI